MINKVINKVAERIESKEQLFYNNSKDVTEDDASKKESDSKQIEETEKKE
jgi:hypothetical protein